MKHHIPNIVGGTQGLITSASFASNTYVEYCGMYLSSNQSGVTVGTDINLVSDISKNMTVSGNTVTLKAGVTYEISGQVRTYSFSDGNGFADFLLVDSSTNIGIGFSSAASTVAPQSNGAFISSPSFVGIFKPTGDTTIKIRCTGALGTCTLDGGGTRLTITAIDFT